MLHDDGPLARFLWPILAAIAGGITALSFRPFRDMRRGEIALAIFVGMTFAIFVGPLAVRVMFGTEPADIKAVGGLFYLMATGANVLIPPVIRKLGTVLEAVFGPRSEP